jgi:glycosyltransferase involved in cell wall biosynthesis
MDHTPLVSVILPTYNRQDLLPKSIESVISQTYTNWELIIWNDGSLDDTEKVALSYKDKDKRIYYYQDENHGMSYALNNAIKKSQAEYIAFLDDDDQWETSKLSHQINILLSNSQVDLVFGNFSNIDLTTGEKGMGFEQNAYSMSRLKSKPIDENTFLIIGEFFSGISISNFIAFDTVAVRRDIISKVGEFNENIRNAMDFEYWWRLALAGGRLAYTNEVILTRIKPRGSLSSPSILTYENKIKALDSCLQETLSRGRKDLVPHLNRAYGNVWQHLMILRGNNGDKKGALNAFIQSMRYGFDLGAVRLFFEAINKSTMRL